MRPVKVGVIGAGYWGPNLIRNFAQLAQAELLGVCDLDPARLAHMRALYPGAKACQDYRELLAEGVEALAIATPAPSHYRITMECLRAGRHVLVEKPLAMNSQQAREMVQTAEEMGKVLLAGHTFLYNPAVLALREIVSSGELGRVYYINSTRVNLGLYQPDINVLWDLAPHDISILVYVLGVKPLSASARGGAYVKPGVHDVAYLSLQFPGGIMADLRFSWLDPCKIRRLTIVGSKKMVVYDDIEPVNKVVIYDKGVDVQPYTDTYAGFHLAYRYGETRPYPLSWDEPLKLECRHFLECIQTGAPARTNGLQGLQVIQVLEAAQKSLCNGGDQERVLW